MSLPESEEILSAIKQLKEKVKTEQGIFEEADKDLKGLQKDIQGKQKALDTLRENLQQEDNYALELLGKLWKQQEKIKGHLAAQSADAIIQAVQEQNEFIDSELELIKQQYENIALNLKICQEFEQFLREDGQDTSHRSIEHKEAFAKFLEGSNLLKEDDKKELLEKNSQLMTELNASMQNLEKRDGNLIEQKKKLQKKDLADNLAVDAQPILQQLFKERQAEIEKEIEVILAENSTIVEQYKNVKLREEEIKKIQGQIEQKTQIIEQSKQKEEQLFEELKQLEQKSYPPLSSAKQQQEDSVSHYPILQERANDVEASLKRQIEINELIKQQKELTSVEKARADNLDQQLTQLQLSTKQEIQAHQKLIDDLQDEIIGLKGEKEQKQFSMPTNEKNWADELQELSESDGSLSDQIDKLTSENDNLRAKLEETEKNVIEQLAANIAEKTLADSQLQIVQENMKELNRQSELAKEELQKSRNELDATQQELITVQESLKAAEQKYGVESKQAEHLQTKLDGLTNENNSLKAQLEKIKKDTKNQPETLSAAEELKYNALVTKQKGEIDELWGRLEVAKEHAQRIQEDEQARVTELRDKDIRIAALARQNAALLSQLEKLQIKPEAYEVEIQTDNIAGKSIGTETETITKEFRAVDSQTDNRQKLYQSVGAEYRSVMDSGVSVDKVLVQDKTKGNVYDDDKILQAFKELSREQVQPIVNKFSLQSTSSFAQFAQENVDGLSEAFRDSEVLREIENIEQRGYTDIHKKFAAEYKDIAWQEKESGKSFNLKQNGKDVVTINETTLSYDVSHDDKNAKYKTREGEEIKNARMVNIPLSIDMQGACHMSFAVQDTNGRNISKEDAVYLTAHYKNGKLVHLTKPTEIFSCSDDNKSPLYLKRKGKTYTLPVDKSTLEQLEQEVLKNKGEYVGIVKNAQGNIRVNSAAVHGLQPDRVTADPLFKDASQLLHDANATPALDGSLDMKGLAHKKPNRNVGGSRNF